MKQILNTLYVQTQGSYLRLDHDTLKLELERKTTFQIPLHHLGGIVAFGNVLISPFLVHRCAQDGRSLVWLSEHGRFRARLSGETTGNVLLRQAQHDAVRDPHRVLSIARYVVAGKLQNARSVLMRAAREAKALTDQSTLKEAGKVHAEAIHHAERAADLDKLRGIEGYAAKAYFSAFTAMLRLNREAFALTERSRRPPRDPINALLSFVYTLLAGECIAACEGVGLDPQVGFLHAVRPGRPALALDLMEELRSPLAGRLILTLINRNQLKPDDFIERPGGAIFLTEDARKILLTAYQKRKQEEISHTVIGTKVPFGLMGHIQARLLARHLRGEVPTYQPFIQR
ncbi:type I-C CRISPR-associated endonuclease Cas1 [Synechococcales cyanobacterium C]|uniref:CRISPR-associated endonuclease Cas1 n=1 Tax=Petrachloros mirabilis ULC683 TaxID=2781853 RepID=A0A8K1ZYM1_9CYAN|nr:type I-C CRISPR-associated endonuclease Cas1 [Petrachloros mirabilis ULC683]